MKVIRDTKFENKVFILEEVIFINCELVSCDLFYSGGDFEWAGTTLSQCRVHFRGPAANTKVLMVLLGMADKGLSTMSPAVSTSVQ